MASSKNTGILGAVDQNSIDLGICQKHPKAIRVFPKMGVPQNGWFIMENPFKVDELRVPLFQETSILPCLE